MKKFLVAYYWMAKHGHGYGNGEVTADYDTPTFENIREIEHQICETHYYAQVVVLNIIELAKEGEDTE